MVAIEGQSAETRRLGRVRRAKTRPDKLLPYGAKKKTAEGGGAAGRSHDALRHTPGRRAGREFRQRRKFSSIVRVNKSESCDEIVSGKAGCSSGVGRDGEAWCLEEVWVQRRGRVG